MKQNCDLCGQALTRLDDDRAVCSGCGLEYRVEHEPKVSEATPPVNPTPVAQPQSPRKQSKSGCGVGILFLVAALDLAVGTHGIVAAFCVVIALNVVFFFKKK